MAEEEQRGFVFHTPNGERDLSIDEVRALAARGDPDGLYALGMAYLFGWDIECNQQTRLENLRKTVIAITA